MVTAKEHVQRLMEGFADINCISYVFNEGRMHAAGYDAGPSESIVIDENGDIVHGIESQHAALLWVVGGDTAKAELSSAIS